MNTPADVGYFSREFFIILPDFFLQIYYFSAASGDWREA